MNRVDTPMHRAPVQIDGRAMSPARRAKIIARDGGCCVEGCGKPLEARGLCKKHYTRLLRHGDPNVTLRVPYVVQKAFLDALPAEGEGCIRWPFAVNSHGHAQVNFPSGGRGQAARCVCERANGPPPSAGRVAAHSCGKGHEACVAPWHLSWKTPQENSADMVVHGTVRRGEAVNTAKLTEAQVREIKALVGQLPYSAIAKRYGVGKAIISQIKRGKSWAHVADEGDA